MSNSLHGHLHPIVDVPKVESSFFAQVAQTTLSVQQLWHRIEGQANQTHLGNISPQDTLEPTNASSGSVGIDTDTPVSFSAALPDDVYLDPRNWINDLPTAYEDSLPPLTVTRP
jgi:hypothetical protein